MKLKEKLADEYWESPANLASCSPKDAFLAGFDKALEMACELFNTSLSNPKYLGQTYHKATTLIARDVLSLGDEEVK